MDYSRVNLIVIELRYNVYRSRWNVLLERGTIGEIFEYGPSQWSWPFIVGHFWEIFSSEEKRWDRGVTLTSQRNGEFGIKKISWLAGQILSSFSVSASKRYRTQPTVLYFMSGGKVSIPWHGHNRSCSRYLWYRG